MCSHARVGWAKFCETSNCRRGKVSVAVVAVPASTPKMFNRHGITQPVAQQRWSCNKFVAGKHSGVKTRSPSSLVPYPDLSHVGLVVGLVRPCVWCVYFQ